MSHWSSGLINCLLPATGGSSLRHGGENHILELGLPVSAVLTAVSLTAHYSGDPDVIHDHRYDRSSDLSHQLL